MGGGGGGRGKEGGETPREGQEERACAADEIGDARIPVLLGNACQSTFQCKYKGV